MRDRDDEDETWNDGIDPVDLYRIYADRELAVLKRENKKLRKNIFYLLGKVGKSNKCGGCGKDIFIVHQENGRFVPYNESGSLHLPDCQKVKEFKKDIRKKESCQK